MGNEDIDKLEKDFKEVILEETEILSEKVSEESTSGNIEGIKKQRKKRKVKSSAKDITQDFSLYIPVIETSVNILFKRLNWSPLTANESKMFTDSFMKVANKYLPSFLEKWSEEINLGMCVCAIAVPRIVYSMQSKEESSEPTI